MAQGVDTSEHQGLLDAAWFAQWDFAILRAFNENGFGDQTFAANWPQAGGQMRHGRGVYGWPIAGANNRALGQQLVDMAPDAELGYWADYEQPPGRALASPAELEEYIRGIQDRGKPAGFYSNVPELPRTPFLDATTYWVAGYGPNDGAEHPLNPAPGRDYLIHQYTSAGGLDRNSADDAALVVFSGRTPITAQEALNMFALKAAPGTPQAAYVALVGESHVDGYLAANVTLSGIPVVQAADQADWDTTIAKRAAPAGSLTVVVDYEKLAEAITAGIKGL